MYNYITHYLIQLSLSCNILRGQETFCHNSRMDMLHQRLNYFHTRASQSIPSVICFNSLLEVLTDDGVYACPRKCTHDRKLSSRVTNPSASTFSTVPPQVRGKLQFRARTGRNVKVAAINTRSSHFSHRHPAQGRTLDVRGSF